MVYCLYFLFTILYCYFVFQVCNLHCLSMHGDKSQSERSRVLESFLAGECPVLVCTALLGRGIDLPNVSQVSFQMIKFGHIMALNVLLIACLGSLFFSPEDSLILNMVLGSFILQKLGIAWVEWANVMLMSFFRMLNKNALFIFTVCQTLFEACSMCNEVYFLTLYR